MSLIILSTTGGGDEGDDCGRGNDCPKLAMRPPDPRVFAVGETVTDPELLAELGVNPGEGAVALPGTCLVRDAARTLEEL
ncbi:MAG: hypothetical protein ACRDYX_10300 [Egibacteraceae bacterium]